MIQFSMIQFSAQLFTFLAATVVAVFSFLSIAIWITTPAKERQVRDRLASSSSPERTLLACLASSNRMMKSELLEENALSVGVGSTAESF